MEAQQAPVEETEKTDTFNLLGSKAVWRIWRFAVRVLYGFRAEGLENMPPEDPYILVLTEVSLASMMFSGWLAAQVLKTRGKGRPEDVLTFMQEELWRFSFFKKFANKQVGGGGYRPLTPRAAGRLSLSLIDGYRMLRRGGVVSMNPEGDLPWDGRPLPFGGSMAWMALHSGAPVVPGVVTIGAYDIWPRWRMGKLPSLRGQVRLRIGKPIKVTEAPLEEISDEDIAAATARVRVEFERLRYDADGPEGWAGPIKRNGKPVGRSLASASPAPAGSQTYAFPPAVQPAKPQAAGSNKDVPIAKRGVSQLLWQCPVCRTHDSLVHRFPFLRADRVHCNACGAHWVLRRVIAKDFRAKLVSGPAEWVGLEMALSDWYALMKSRWQPLVLPAPTGVTLQPDEQVYLIGENADLLPYRPNALFDGYPGREPPKVEPAGKREYANWDSVGKGRLVLTDRRLLWQGPQGELDFRWEEMTAVVNINQNVLGVRYGSAMYRIDLAEEVGLEWLTYASHFAREASATPAGNASLRRSDLDREPVRPSVLKTLRASAGARPTPLT